MVSGEMTVAEAGDILHFDSGAKVTFSSASSGLAFYCGLRGEGEL